MAQRRQGTSKLEIAFGTTVGPVIDSMNEEERKNLSLPFAAKLNDTSQMLIAGWASDHKISFFIVFDGRQTLFTRTRHAPPIPEKSRDLPSYVDFLEQEVVLAVRQVVKGVIEFPEVDWWDKARWSRDELDKGVERAREELKGKLASHHDAVFTFITGFLPSDTSALLEKTTVGLEHLNALNTARDTGTGENLAAQELLFYPAIAGAALENKDIAKELARGISLEEAFENAFDLDHEGWRVLSLLEQSKIAKYGQEYLFPVMMIALSVINEEVLKKVETAEDARSLYDVIETLVYVILDAYVPAGSNYADSHVNMGFIVAYLINEEVSPAEISVPERFHSVFQLIAERTIHDACVPALRSFDKGTKAMGDWEGIGGLVMQNLIWQLGLRQAIAIVDRYQGSLKYDSLSEVESIALSRIAAEALAMAFPALTERERGLAVMTDLPNTLTWRRG
ncbi:hypothetical protein [Rhizobium sp. BK176]|uniref:hypothetical protein n=1 Tax=Rhizobium sp. BK176 TaxID=2587071 RepID=UPI00216A3063|nr:hypothetical protein [Rhizobium sp. BK176]MCS4089342.1 hypothetical protein [Rhizobium sp. BK176]